MTLQCIFCLRQNEALAFVLTISFIVVVEHLLCVTSDKLFIEDQQKEDERAEGMIARQEAPSNVVEELEVFWDENERDPGGKFLQPEAIREQRRRFGSQETSKENLKIVLCLKTVF